MNNLPKKKWDQRTWEQRQVVPYICENAPDFELPDGHTKYKIDYHGVDGRGAAWAAGLRLQKCEKCGGYVAALHEIERREVKHG